jgi:hypothetical protein
MIEAIGLDVLGNVAAHQPDFTGSHPPVRFVERQFAVAQALDLAADQRNAALERFEDFILVPCATILRDQPLVVVGFIGGFLRRFFGRG